MSKVLVVDDDVSVRRLVGACLRKQQFILVQAHTGVEAIERATAELPDLIIMDVMLPGSSMNGLLASQLIKRNPITAGCKVLLISGAVEVEDEILVESGAEGFLAKPFNPTSLRDKIHQVLGEGAH